MTLDERIYSIPEAAAVAGCGKSTMAQYVNTGQITPIRQFGRKRFIPESALKDFIRLHTVRYPEDEERILKVEAKAKRKAGIQ